MNREAGAYIEKDGQILPDLTDEAMAGRKKLAEEATAATEKPKKSKTAEPPAEVTIA